MSIFANLTESALYAVERYGNVSLAERLTNFQDIASQISDVIEILDYANENGKYNDVIDTLLDINETIRGHQSSWGFYQEQVNNARAQH